MQTQESFETPPGPRFENRTFLLGGNSSDQQQPQGEMYVLTLISNKHHVKQ